MKRKVLCEVKELSEFRIFANKQKQEWQVREGKLGLNSAIIPKQIKKKLNMSFIRRKWISEDRCGPEHIQMPEPKLEKQGTKKEVVVNKSKNQLTLLPTVNLDVNTQAQRSRIKQ